MTDSMFTEISESLRRFHKRSFMRADNAAENLRHLSVWWSEVANGSQNRDSVRGTVKSGRVPSKKMESRTEDEDVKKRKDNPKHGANPISVMFFWWTTELFKLGYKKPIIEDDLFKPVPCDCSEYLGDELERHWNSQVDKCKSGNKKPSLSIAILKTFGPTYFGLGFVLSLNELCIRIIQPLFLGKMLTYFHVDSKMKHEDALLCAAGIVGCTAINAMILNHYTMEAFRMGMRVRVACCSLLYRKSLRLSSTALGETAIGKVINLLANDVARFDLVAITVNYLWISPLAAIIVTYLVYQDLGIGGIVGIAAIFIVVTLQSWTGRLTSKFRMRSAVRTDERVRLMDEIVRGIRVIKMYAWEKPFAKLVGHARRSEINVIRKASFIRGLYMTFNLFTTRMALFCAVATYVFLGNIVSADKVFVASSYFTILSFTMSGIFVRGVAEVAEASVSIRRLQNFLLLDEHIDKKALLKEAPPQSMIEETNGIGGKLSQKDQKEDKAIRLEKLDAKWNTASSDKTLSDINMSISHGTLLGIIGPVGSGKSSLLQAILGEVPIISGSLNMAGRIAYASQEPWVFGGTIRQNILFGAAFDEKRYRHVTSACALRRDFRQLPRGDLTNVGDRGSLLSGGQKARVNLARALYGKADIFLLDDPLSAVDAHVGKHLVDQCLTGPLLRGATVLLATHQLQHLRHADEIIVLEEGSIKAQGTYEELLGTAENEDADEDQEENKEGIAGLIRHLSRISATSKRSSLGGESTTAKKEEEERVEKEDEAERGKKGSVDGMVYLRYLTSGAHPLSLMGLAFLFTLSQVAASGVDYFVSYWTKQEEFRLVQRKLNSSQTENDTMHEFRGQTLISEFIQVRPVLLSEEWLLGIYGSAVASLFIISITRSLIFYIICMRCSTNLHDSMFRSIVQAPMYFFDSNPSGRILNRFSKDMGSIDEFLPKALLDSTQILMIMVGAIAVSASVNYYFLVPVLFLGIIFWIIRNIYLHISRKVKRIEGITRSPVFTHIGATLEGLPTIRSHGAQKILKNEFDRIQDINTSAYFMYISISTGFGFCLDVMCLIYISVVTFSFLFLDQDAVGGNVGLAITQSMMLTGMFQWGVRQTAEVENQMTSVERVLEYTDLDEEETIEDETDQKPQKGWPSKGEIKYGNVGMSYKKNGPLVIRHLSFTIHTTEKVGVVGRTGAGKSSLVASLLRIGCIEEGTLCIDGVNICDIGLQHLRSSISVIPQDPVLFSGTLRSNLDPFQEYSDDLIWRALEDVELKEIASETVGLDTRILAGGSNLSVGQRQLLCLARAILRRNKILLLDEATANVDPKTDALIQTTIRQKFAACTVITVAHRLNTIMDYDKVLVMDAGRMVEFNHPYRLLQNKDGYFFKMVQQTGYYMAETLLRVAKEAYDKYILQSEVNQPNEEETTNL